MGENMKMIKIELRGLLIIFFSITIFIASIVLNSDLLLSGVLIVWMAMIIYCFAFLFDIFFYLFNWTRSMFLLFWSRKILY